MLLPRGGSSQVISTLRCWTPAVTANSVGAWSGATVSSASGMAAGPNTTPGDRVVPHVVYVAEDVTVFGVFVAGGFAGVGVFLRGERSHVEVPVLACFHLATVGGGRRFGAGGPAGYVGDDDDALPGTGGAVPALEQAALGVGVVPLQDGHVVQVRARSPGQGR